MDWLVSAFLVGLSFGNMWMCVLLVMSLQGAHRKTAAGFLVGRAAAVFTLAVLVSILGHKFSISRSAANLFSGLFLCGFAVYLFATRVLNFKPPWKSEPSTEGISCDHNCATCPSKFVHSYAAACADCKAGDGVCEAEEFEVRPFASRTTITSQSGGFAVGVLIGSVRGAVLCGKLTVLLPLLLRASLMKAAGIAAAFTVSSSIYPLLGFAFGDIALKALRYKRTLFIASCALMFALGTRYLLKAVL